MSFNIDLLKQELGKYGIEDKDTKLQRLIDE